MTLNFLDINKNYLFLVKQSDDLSICLECNKYGVRKQFRKRYKARNLSAKADKDFIFVDESFHAVISASVLL